MAAALLVKNWEKDMVYLVQIPRAGAIPSLSPFCLKLETWLRMAKISYQNVSNNFSHNSRKGQIPFVELNGRQIPDSNHIITELRRIFSTDLDRHLYAPDWSRMEAYHCLVENGILWCNLYYRSLDNSYMATPDGIIAHFSGFKKFVFKHFVMGRRLKKLQEKCLAMGIGRDSLPEVDETCKRELQALSVILGDNLYVMGDHPTTVDATTFATLCMFYYLPVSKEMKRYLDEDVPNLVRYMLRVRGEFWPDWEECTGNLSLHTNPQLPASTPA